jgi:hypothetical protein
VVVADLTLNPAPDGFFPLFMFYALAVEPSGTILALDSTATLLSLLTGGSGSLWRVNQTTGSSTLLSTFGNPGQGPVGIAPWTITVDGAGSIVVGGRGGSGGPAGVTLDKGAVFRVHPVTGNRSAVSDFANSNQGPTVDGAIVDIDVISGSSSSSLTLASGGVVATSTTGTSANVQSGYATVAIDTGSNPYGTAVFSLSQNGVVVSEAGVPASPPTQSARIFIDYRTAVSTGSGTLNISTGFAIAHRGNSPAAVTYTVRDRNAQILATGNSTLGVGAHFAKFIHELRDVAPDFNLPGKFSTTTLFGSLEITSSQPVSIVALRLTTNQRGETLLTSTPIADLSTASTSSPIYFPQLADGGGYTTTLILLNTSTAPEVGTFDIFDDSGAPLTVRESGGTIASSFPYSMPAGGAFVFQTDGSPATPRVGWAKLTPGSGSHAPVGAGVFSFSHPLAGLCEALCVSER